MAYNTKPIVTDKDGNPISQYYNPDTDSYEPVEGVNGANKVLVENNDLSLIPILDKLNQLTGTVIDEETRKQNEIVRQNTETTREDNENIRQSNESTRQSNENARIEAENVRKNNEDMRIANENNRKNNETERITAEQVRENAESERQSNELIRQQNESIRQSNEDLRITLYNDLLEKVVSGYFKGEKGETGNGLEYMWDGTKLGIRVEGETEYVFVDLRGPQGPAGDIDNLTSQHIETALGYTPVKSVNNVVANEIGNVELDIDTSEIENRIGNVENDLAAHKAEKATQEQLGHVKAGNNITIDEDGTINAKGGDVDSVNGKTGEVVIDVGDIAGLAGSGLALGNAASAGDSSVALGESASSTGGYSVALGRNASATWIYSVALGYNASAAGMASVALGRNASAEDSSFALGNKASAEGYSVALGGSASAGSNAVALGESASAAGRFSVALGNDTSVENNNEGILGGTGTYSASKWKVPGSFTVNGTKNFEIPHPKPEKRATHVIRHGAVESPTPGDTLYRYKIQATKDNDMVTIDLPDYFVWLNKDVQIWVTGQGHFGNGYGTLNRETERLEIHCQFAGDYNVLVIGTRNDDHQSVQDWNIKGVEREVGESWTGETYVFSVDEIMEVEEIKEVSA